MYLQNVKRVCARALLFLLVWWVLTNGDLASLGVGIPTALAAGVLSVFLQPTVRLSALAGLKFLPFFLLHSVKGGVDVAWRVFHPSLPINPVMLEYPTQLPEGFARMMMLSIITLLPGTLSVDLDTGVLKIHVLNGTDGITDELRSIERHIAKIFYTPLGGKEE